MLIEIEFDAGDLADVSQVFVVLDIMTDFILTSRTRGDPGAAQVFSSARPVGEGEGRGGWVGNRVVLPSAKQHS